MIRKYRIFCIITMALFIYCNCSSSSENFYGGSYESTFRGASDIMKSKPETRFAVLDFTDSSGSFTAYGKVIGDETFYRLSSLKGINLIERQKLSAIMEEHQLEQSGLISGRSDERTGKILPVDIIVVGSYIFESDRIRVNGRFTDVTSGEIKGTFVYYLKSPYGDKGQGIDIPEDEPLDCSAYEKMITPVLRDLRTPAKIENAVRTAITIPFTMKCYSIHQHIMTTFKRGGIYPELYKQFLRNTVISIGDPEEMKRKTAVFYYFQSDKKIDEMEWNTGILSMKNASERTIRRIVFFILNRGESQDEKILRNRIDMLMALTGDGLFGKPRILTRDKMFNTIFRVGMANETTLGIRLYMLEKYASTLPKDKLNMSLILSYSEKTLVHEKDPQNRKRVYDHLSRLLSSIKPEDQYGLTYQLISFIFEIHYRYGKTDKDELRKLSLALSRWLCYATTQIRRDYRLRSAIRILQAYKIKCGHQ
jgi:TolB-like protein